MTLTDLEAAARAATPDDPPRSGRTPEMMQDDCRALSRWLSTRPGARLHAREAAAAISRNAIAALERTE